MTFISSADLRKEIDETLIESKHLEVLSDDLKVDYERYKGSFPFAGRDFVMVSAIHREEKGILWANKSIPYPYPEVKDVVRG